MAIYAIGDVQGCYDEVTHLLDTLNIDPATDEVWFVGDLVNRGPGSLEVLRLVRSLGNAATVTLGNHDLHLLAAAETGRQPDDSLAPVLAAPDADELLDWLRDQPLTHYRPDLNTLMVHAGIPHEWTPELAVELGREVEAVLQGSGRKAFFMQMYGEQPDRWSPELQGMERLRCITNGLTRIRFCRDDGRMDFTEKGSPGEQPAGLVPWFDLPGRATESVRVVIGHWSTLGLVQRDNLLALDTGCVWGRQLTAARLDGPLEIHSVPATSRPPHTLKN
jgi:bis(5'-nucleosyl)-tetraphosphatase (symmetrical)